MADVLGSIDRHIYVLAVDSSVFVVVELYFKFPPYRFFR